MVALPALFLLSMAFFDDFRPQHMFPCRLLLGWWEAYEEGVWENQNDDIEDGGEIIMKGGRGIGWGLDD